MTTYEVYASVDEADQATRLLRAAFDGHGLFFPSLHVQWAGNGNASIQLGLCTADAARALAALLEQAAPVGASGVEDDSSGLPVPA